MEKSINIIGGDSGFAEIEINEDFTHTPNSRDIQTVENNLSIIKHLRETSITEKRA